MATVAQRGTEAKALIRGRKRKPGTRHPCGKRIHAETEREIMHTAIDARQRHYGVTARQARDVVSAPRSDGWPTRS